MELGMKRIAYLFDFLFAGSANATLIDFEGVATASTQLGVGNNYIEEGFNFFNPGATTDAAIIGQPFQNICYPRGTEISRKGRVSVERPSRTKQK